MHLYLEVIGAGIGMIPLTALAMSYLRNRSPRIALALLGFVALEVRFITMIAIHTVVVVDHGTEELVDFGGDLAIMAAFAAAFLIGSRWLRERGVSQPA